MPGVPSGRGCDACRKQKKKCDQKKPGCARCSRLSIPCIGGGVQRYKFKHERMESAVVAKKKDITYRATASGSHLVSSAVSGPLVLTGTPKACLISKSSSLASAFVSVLETPDVRYDIYTFGVFYGDLIRRLGHNPVLDASVLAMTTAFKSLQIKDKKVDAFAQYGNALNMIRSALQDPRQYQNADTTCAIYNIIICETWLGNQSRVYAKHGMVLWHLLKNAALNGWAHQFEPLILKTMGATVVLESICNQDIKLEPWFWDLLDGSGRPTPWKTNEGATFHSLETQNLALIREFIQEPQKNHMRITWQYALAMDEYPKLRKTVDVMEAMAAAPDATLKSKKLVTRFQTLLALILSMALILNRILRGLDVEDALLVTEADILCDAIVELARSAAEHRPLPVAFMSTALSIAWMSAPSLLKQAEAEVLLLEYDEDFPDSHWLFRAAWMKRAMDKMVPLNMELEGFSADLSPDHEELAALMFGEPCTIL